MSSPSKSPPASASKSPPAAAAAEESTASDLTIDRIVDVMDFEVEHILWERMSRLPHYEALKYFWKLFPGREIEHGRRYIRKMMAEILSSCCASDPYGKPADEESDLEDEAVDEVDYLYKWNADRWEELRGWMTLLRRLLLREDAEINYMNASDVTEDAGQLVTERANSNLFTKKYKLVMRFIDLHVVLAPIRFALESQVKDMGKQRIRKTALTKVIADIMALDDDTVKEALTTLIVGDDKEEGTFQLARVSHLKEVLATAPFDLCHFQDSLENFIHKSNRLVSGDTDCSLIAAKYTIPTDSDLYGTLAKRLTTRLALFSERRKAREKIDHEKELEGLRRGRLHLGNSHGEDPLEESLQVAQGAGGGPADGDDEPTVEGSKRKRSNKKQLVILEEIDDDEEDDAKEIARLSKVPRRRTSAGALTSPGGFVTIAPDEGIFDIEGKVLKRLKWTDDEKMCVKEGVKKHGMGKWKQIKFDHEQILRNRTPVQMKDCWRTMTKHNEV